MGEPLILFGARSAHLKPVPAPARERGYAGGSF